METITKIGSFGVMDLTLTLSDDAALTLFIDLNNGEYIGKGKIHLFDYRVRKSDISAMLSSVEMWNTVANGSGTRWRFDLVLNYVNADNIEVSETFNFGVLVIKQKLDKPYSRLQGYSQQENFGTSYRGAMHLSTINHKLERMALREEALDLPNSDSMFEPSDLVSYFRERNLNTAARFCPDMGLEEIPLPGPKYSFYL